MTMIICKSRGTGKTTDLIRKAHGKGLYILVGNMSQAQAIYQRAIELKMPINYPITVREWKDGSVGWRLKEKGILVDEGQHIIEELLETQVHVMSITKKESDDIE